MRTKQRRAAWFLASVTLLFVLVGVIFPAAACCHTCLGSHCPVCLQMRMFSSTLRIFGVLLLCAFSAAATVFAAWTDRAEIFLPARRTPVTLKIKLLN